MQYGDKGWQEWALGEDEAVEHIKYAYAPSVPPTSSLLTSAQL